MSQHTLTVVAAAGLAVFVVALGLLAVRRARRWRRAVRAAAERYRLAYRAVKRSLTAIHDSAAGTFEGRAISISVDEEESGRGADSRTVRFMKLEVGGDFGAELSLVPRAARERESRHVAVIDFGAEPSAKGATPTCDAEIDRRFEIKGARPALIAALTGELRPTLLVLAPHGLHIGGGEVLLRTRRLPKAPEEMSSRIDELIALAKALEAVPRR